VPQVGLGRRVCALLLVAAGAVCRPAGAQLLSIAKGATQATQSGASSGYSYRVGYLQKLKGDLSAEFDYVNEGHFDAHHRDGYALQASVKVLSLDRYRTWVNVGVGPYYYFDTQRDGHGGSLDVHGLAPSVSATLRHQLNSQVDLVASVDAVFPNHDFHAYTASLGFAHWLGRDAAARRLHVAPEDREPEGFFEPREQLITRQTAVSSATPYELSLFNVVSVINVVSNPKSEGVAVEARWRFVNRFEHHYDLTLGYLNEGDPRVSRRSGVTLQLWPVRSDPVWHFDLAVGLGAYVYVDKRAPVVPGKGPAAAVAPVLSVMLTSQPLYRGVFLRLAWDRVVSDYNRDADVWRVGVGKGF
jgi:hypothetical protein